jgi:hypothetical protein
VRRFPVEIVWQSSSGVVMPTMSVWSVGAPSWVSKVVQVFKGWVK